MNRDSYVLITAAKNEQGTIEETLRSVLGQEVLPAEWIIVSDGSTDRTDEIVRAYTSRASFIKLVQLQQQPVRTFSSQVRAIQAGYARLQCRDYGYLGLLDADLRFPAHYYKSLIARFEDDSSLGIIGGLAVDVADGPVKSVPRNLGEVAGATQFYRRECFEIQDGLLPIPEGGYDAIACARARMHGFKTRTFEDLVVDHLKPRNAAFGNPLRRKWQLGMRDRALAYHPLFELVKCCSRFAEAPFAAGSVAWFLGYTCSALAGRRSLVPPDVRRYLRREQMKRLFGRFGPAPDAPPRSRLARADTVAK